MDTVNSLAIQWLEGLLQRIGRWVQGGALRARDTYERLSSLLKQVKYSYLEPEDIERQFLPQMLQLAEQLITSAKTEEQRRLLEYLNAELQDLPRKLRVATEPYRVFRYRFGEIVSVSRHPTLDNLLITKVRTKDGELTVITNLHNVKEGQKAVVVMLPPREFGGIWSEAMFVKVGINDLKDLREEDLKELSKYFFEFTSF